jgi:hypothetical protein
MQNIELNQQDMLFSQVALRGVAPAGRLIRSAGNRQAIIPNQSPANLDQVSRAARSAACSYSLRAGVVSALGLIGGVVIALLLPAGMGVFNGDKSRALMTSLKLGLVDSSNLVNLTSASERVGQARHDSRQLIPNVGELRLSTEERQETPIHKGFPEVSTQQSLAKNQAEPELVRLASLDIPHPKQVKQQVENHPTADKKEIVAKVHSIISKHAPKNTNPESLAEAIVAESFRQSYDPLFVAAVIKSESTFNVSARSNRGAQGLMQIMKPTGDWISSKHGYASGKLTDPGHNLKLGISYLKYLESEYNGNRLFALVAYNWGPGHVGLATSGKKRIPKQCMNYALKILRDYKSWKSGVI